MDMEVPVWILHGVNGPCSLDFIRVTGENGYLAIEFAAVQLLLYPFVSLLFTTLTN